MRTFNYAASMLVACAAVLAVVIVHAGAQQQPTFTTTTNLVTLNVSVLDRNRKPIRGLIASDFVVSDGGEERPVVALSMIEMRPRAASSPLWNDAAELDVVTNAPKNGRLVVIFFDRVGGAWSADRARRIAANAIAELGPDDMAAVVYANPIGTPINFTSDRARLLQSIHSPTLIVPPTDLSCYCGLCTLESLLLVARILEPVREVPKMVIFVGGSIAVDLPPTDPCAIYTIPVAHEMFRALQRAQIPVHAVDPGGVNPPGAFTAQTRSIPFGAGGRGPNYDPLRILAANTGGRVVIGTNAPDEKVQAIFDESEVQYLIGFIPRAATSRDPVQRISVRVRRQDVTVLAPAAYRQPYERPSSAVPLDPVKAAAAAAVSTNVHAVSNLRPVADIAMRAAVSAVPDATDRDRSFVATVLGIDLPVKEPAPITAQIEISAYDTEGRRQGLDQQTVTLTPAQGATSLTVDVLSRMALRPQTYEIRASAVTADGKVGSVYTHVTVDNFARTPLAMSGIFLNASTAPRLVTLAATSAWLPLAPTTRRDFARADHVSAGVRLVQPRELATTSITIETAIVDATGRRAVSIPATLPPQAFSPGRVADHRVDVPLGALAPGEYLLTITATLGKTTVSRTARFRVS